MTAMAGPVNHTLRFVKRRDSSEDNPGELILDEEFRLENAFFYSYPPFSDFMFSDSENGARTAAAKFSTTAADSGRPR